MTECGIGQRTARTASTVLDIKPVLSSGLLVAHEYSLNIAVAGDRSSSAKCDDGQPAEENILTVEIPVSNNILVLKGPVNVPALNAGLKHAGNMRQFDPLLVEKARACFASNLARAVVELTRKDNSYATETETIVTASGTLSTALGNDLLAGRDIAGNITLSSLDAVAGIIQHGITTCKAGKVR